MCRFALVSRDVVFSLIMHAYSIRHVSFQIALTLGFVLILNQTRCISLWKLCTYIQDIERKLEYNHVIIFPERTWKFTSIKKGEVKKPWWWNNSMAFSSHKSGPARKQHTYQSINIYFLFAYAILWSIPNKNVQKLNRT